MTINQHISNLRDLIKEYGDDSKYTDSRLYEMLTAAKAKLLKQKRKISNFSWQTYCIGLEKVKAHDCDCIQAGCDVLRSKFKIPTPLEGRYSTLFRVMTLGDIVIPIRSETQFEIDKFDDIKKGKRNYWIRNQHLILRNDLNLKALVVRGIWDDLTEWAEVDLCDDSGTTIGKCFDISNDDFGMDKDLAFDSYIMVVNKLFRLTLQLKSDINNDSNSEIRN